MMLFTKKYVYFFYFRFNLSKVAKIDLRTLEFQVFRNSVSIQTSYYSKEVILQYDQCKCERKILTILKLVEGQVTGEVRTV